MKIAVIADVHGNLPALEAVIAHARSVGAEEFWNLGDMVGYGPCPNECARTLQKTCKYNIYGNHDEKSLSPKKIQKMRDKRKDPDKVFSFEWTQAHLAEDVIAFIRSLPPAQMIDVEGHRILLTHGSPEGTDDGITPRTSVSRLEELAGLTDAELILCGHTHVSFDRIAGNVRFVNPGGAGRSFDGDPRAAYCILDITKNGINVEQFRLEYDLDLVAAAMKSYSFPERMVRSLMEARSLDEVDDVIHSAGWEAAVASALSLGARAKFEEAHALKVTELALKIFDGLSESHGLTIRERVYLQCAAILHDIGFPVDPARHHKIARDMILEARELLFSRRERLVVGLIARYHRGSLPDPDHKYYSELPERDRQIVGTLAGVLRVADGLDRTHRALVQDVAVKIKSDSITLQVRASSNVDEEIKFALLKGDLLQQVFKRVLAVEKKK